MAANMKPEEIAPMVTKLRSTWLAGKTRDASWRKAQLKALHRMLIENHGRMKDFRKDNLSKMEVDLTAAAVDHILDDLDERMQDINAGVPIASVGGSAKLHPEPYGVILVISAWNYPLSLLLQPAAGAIAAGNCVVLKPSELSANVSDLLVELVPKYLDPETIRVAAGPIQIGSALLDVKWDYICFTGSTAVGKIVYQAAAKHLTPVLLELGGKSPTYVHSDIDVDFTAKRLVWGKFLNCGQTCIAPDYILLNSSIKDKFVAGMVKYIKQFYGEDATKSKDYEQIVNDRHVQRLAGLLKNQSVHTGGRVDAQNRYIEPTILLDPSPDAPVMQEEIFGPILPIITVNSVEEAISFINARPKPLALYAFTYDKGVQEKIKTRTSSGSLMFNETVMQFLNSNIPFGGVGESGLGGYHGKYTFDTFTHYKPVQSAPTLPDPGFKFPPYTDSGYNITKFLFVTLKPSYLRRFVNVVGVAMFSVVAYFVWKKYF